MGLAAALSGVLAACSEKTAGSTFETENSVATVVVLHADGTPAAYSHVQVCEKDAFVNFLGTGLSDVGESYETDDAGVLTLKDLKPGDYLVEAAVGDQSLSGAGAGNYDTAFESFHFLPSFAVVMVLRISASV